MLCLPELETLLPCLGDCYCSCLQGNIPALWAGCALSRGAWTPGSTGGAGAPLCWQSIWRDTLPRRLYKWFLRAFLAIQMWVGLNLNSQTDFSGSKEPLVKFQILCPCYFSFFRKCSNVIFLQQNLSFILLNGWKFLFWFFSPEKSSASGRYALWSPLVLSSPWYAPCICCTHFIFSFHLPAVSQNVCNLANPYQY